jgi:hypothetical protein
MRLLCLPNCHKTLELVKNIVLTSSCVKTCEFGIGNPAAKGNVKTLKSNNYIQEPVTYAFSKPLSQAALGEQYPWVGP